MKFNKELAEAAVARIEADPEAWVQGSWHSPYRSEELGRPAGCFALHVCLAAGLELFDPTGGSEVFVATEKSDALGFGRMTDTVWDRATGDYRSIEAAMLPGSAWPAEVNDAASFLLTGRRTDPSWKEERSYRAANKTFVSSNDLDDIKAAIAKAEGAGRYRIEHASANNRHGHSDRVTVDGKDAVKAFLANLDVDDLEFVSVRRLED